MIYQWSEPSKTKKGILVTKTSAWTQAVRNRMRQKAGELQASQSLERGEEKWCKEHLRRKGPVPISVEGRDLLEDKEKWGDQTSFRSKCHESRKRERVNEDGSFKLHQKGPITSTYTADWCHREGEFRHKLGDWLKATSVNSEDQKRMLQAITHSFPSNVLVHRNTKGKESNKGKDNFDLSDW